MTQRALALAGLLQRVQDAADLRVDQIDHRPVGGPHQAVVAVGQVAVAERARDVVGADLVEAPLEDRLVVQLPLPEGRQWYVLQPLQIARQVVGRRVERVVRVERIHRQQPRPPATGVGLDEGDGLLRAPGGLMVRLPDAGLDEPRSFERLRPMRVWHAAFDQPVRVGVGRRVVFRIAPVGKGLRRPLEVVVAVVAPLLADESRGGVGGAGVQLADQPAVVAGVGQQPADRQLVGGDGLTVLAHARRARVAPGQEAGAAGSAQRVLHEAAVEAHAAGRQGVQVRGADERVPGAAQRVAPLLVGADPEDVRAIGHRPR